MEAKTVIKKRVAKKRVTKKQTTAASKRRNSKSVNSKSVNSNKNAKNKGKEAAYNVTSEFVKINMSVEQPNAMTDAKTDATVDVVDESDDVDEFDASLLGVVMPMILHLKVHVSDLEQKYNLSTNEYCKYEPSITTNSPQPYDPTVMRNSFVSLLQASSSKKSTDLAELQFKNNDTNTRNGNTDNTTTTANGNGETDLDRYEHMMNDRLTYIDFYKSIPNKVAENEIRYEFQFSNKNNEWPTRTHIACFWCCHEFDTPPCGIPVKFENGKYYISGCYCSYNCAAAGIMSNNNYDKWTSYSLLHILFNKVHKVMHTEMRKKKRGKKSTVTQQTGPMYSLNIKPSAPKEVLIKFGGKISIEEYRKNLYSNKKSYKITEPPLISIIPTIKEEDSFNLDNFSLDILNNFEDTDPNQSSDHTCTCNTRQQKIITESIEEYYNSIIEQH